jgi:hypothetical protein
MFSNVEMLVWAAMLLLMAAPYVLNLRSAVPSEERLAAEESGRT